MSDDHLAAVYANVLANPEMPIDDRGYAVMSAEDWAKLVRLTSRKVAKERTPHE